MQQLLGGGDFRGTVGRRLRGRSGQVHVQGIPQAAQVVLDFGNLPLDVVVFGQVDAGLLGRLVQRDQMLPVLDVREDVFLEKGREMRLDNIAIYI